MKAARFESAGLRFPIALGFVIPVFILSLAIPHLTRTNGTLLGALLSSLVACGLGVAVYVAYVRRIERRPVTELALPGAGKELGNGFVLGAALFAIAIGTLALLGDYNVHGRHDLGVVAIPVVASSFASSRARSVPGSRWSCRRRSSACSTSSIRTRRCRARWRSCSRPA